jgi:hypothetical protein
MSELLNFTRIHNMRWFLGAKALSPQGGQDGNPEVLLIPNGLDRYETWAL